MKILITRSNPIAPDPRVAKIAKSLLSAGYSVNCLGWDRTGNLPEYEVQNGVPIARLPITAEFGKGLGNLPQLLRWQKGLLKWLRHHREEFDIIHACDFDTILPALWMKLFYRKKVVYDIFDFYADHLRSTPALIISIIRKIDLWSIGKVDAVILVDDARVPQISGSHLRNLAIIYNSPVDMEIKIAPPAQSSYSFKMAYIGLLQVERGLLEMLSVLKKHPEWSLDLAGFGGDEAQILEIASSLPNVIWHGRVNYDEAIRISAGANALFATYDPAIPNHKYSSPNKVFEAMMLGKPIIVSAETNMDRIIAQANCGVIIPYGNIVELENAIKLLADHPSIVLEMGSNARHAYESFYNWNLMHQRLVALYDKVLVK
ncbi:MAG TPA: glycosyltransferase WbuB [Anaerolineaceae bacterium]|nr:glycosyltransferase WbuB [Anaerolineaceae bacterium]